MPESPKSLIDYPFVKKTMRYGHGYTAARNAVLWPIVIPSFVDTPNVRP